MNAFLITFGAELASLGVMSAVAIRSASAPLWTKMALPALAVAAGLITAITVNSLLGYATSAALPAEAELIAFTPAPDEHSVYLWLRTEAGPRAYETPLDETMKKTLGEAGAALGRGQRAMLKQAGREGDAADAPRYTVSVPQLPDKPGG